MVLCSLSMYTLFSSYYNSDPLRDICKETLSCICFWPSSACLSPFCGKAASMQRGRQLRSLYREHAGRQWLVGIDALSLTVVFNGIKASLHISK
uniref:Uncharacterized protein n=1 Tax=Anguilla anguilla TaxID=7936 RepID=A0A0E9S5F6_ANGAN